MNIIKLQGGLGNQLFQYAYGRSLELSGKRIIFDTSFFTGSRAKVDTARNFKLGSYNIETCAKFSDRKHPIIDIYYKIKRNLGVKVELFYQNESFFHNITDEISKEFQLKNPLTARSAEWQRRIRSTRDSISLHVRRGDYIINRNTNDYHGSLNIAYYSEAISLMAKKLGMEVSNLNIFVFSDDIRWARENLRFPCSMDFVSDSQAPDYEELYLMSLCENNIIANSTFSWWGAWLNQNQNKIVIAPKQWLKDKTSEALNVLPNKWFVI